MQLEVTLEKLDKFAADFWAWVKDTRVFAVHGPMGAGKTTTIAALCRYKGVQEALSSPTFSIINEYQFKEGSRERKIYHIDLYRLKDDEEVVQTGVEDCVYSGDICFVEWPEKAPYLFDEEALHVVIEPVGEKERMVKVLTAEAFKNQSVAEQL